MGLDNSSSSTGAISVCVMQHRCQQNAAPITPVSWDNSSVMFQ